MRRSEPRAAGLVVDYGPDGRAVGVAITAPTQVTLTDLNERLADLGQAAMGSAKCAPLVA